MSLREKWEFEYAAKALAEAAKHKANHHKAREKFWRDAKDKVMAEVRNTGIEVDDGVDVGISVSNRARGPRVMVRNDLQDKLTDCQQKIGEHNYKVTEYEGWYQVLAAAGDARLKLNAEDYLFFFGS